tara:strand:- start:2243 stop:2437 length:195 start_codon:yes stop_codon:yes gene_type:complete
MSLSYKKINKPAAFDVSGYIECVLRTKDSDGKADNAVIPFSEDNRDYIEYKAWLDAGNVPEDAD